MYVIERTSYSLFDMTKTDKVFVPSIFRAIRFIEIDGGTYHSDDCSDIVGTFADSWKRVYYKISKANKSDLSYRCVSPELQTISDKSPYERQRSLALMNPFVTMKKILSETLMNNWPAYWEDL